MPIIISDDDFLMVHEKLLTILLKLPDGFVAGRWEAARAFAELNAELRRRYPDKTFQLLPFSFYKAHSSMHGDGVGLYAILATAN